MIDALVGINDLDALPHLTHALVLTMLPPFVRGGGELLNTPRGFQLDLEGPASELLPIFERHHRHPIRGAAAADPLDLPDFTTPRLDLANQVVFDVTLAFWYFTHFFLLEKLDLGEV